VRSSCSATQRAATDAETPELVGEPIRLRFQFPVTESLVTVSTAVCRGTRRRGLEKFVKQGRRATAGSKGSPLRPRRTLVDCRSTVGRLKVWTVSLFIVLCHPYKFAGNTSDDNE